jgi:hypothetical protein
VGSVPDFIENHRAGRLRVLAVLRRARPAALPEVRDHLGQLGQAVDVMSQTQLATREAAYSRNWAEIIKRSGFQPQ